MDHKDKGEVRVAGLILSEPDAPSTDQPAPAEGVKLPQFGHPSSYRPIVAQYITLLVPQHSRAEEALEVARSYFQQYCHMDLPSTKLNGQTQDHPLIRALANAILETDHYPLQRGEGDPVAELLGKAFVDALWCYRRLGKPALYRGTKFRFYLDHLHQHLVGGAVYFTYRQAMEEQRGLLEALSGQNNWHGLLTDRFCTELEHLEDRIMELVKRSRKRVRMAVAAGSGLPMKTSGQEKI